MTCFPVKGDPDATKPHKKGGLDRGDSGTCSAAERWALRVSRYTPLLIFSAGKLVTAGHPPASGLATLAFCDELEGYLGRQSLQPQRLAVEGLH